MGDATPNRGVSSDDKGKVRTVHDVCRCGDYCKGHTLDEIRESSDREDDTK